MTLLSGHTTPFKKVEVAGLDETTGHAVLQRLRSYLLVTFRGLAYNRRRSITHLFRFRFAMTFPTWAQAGLWGLVSGSALLLGAAIGYFTQVPQRLIAAIMAFGSGVLISTLSLELMEEAYRKEGISSTAAGFVGGAVAYTFANWLLAYHGAKHRKRSGHRQKAERVAMQQGQKAGDETHNSLALAVGALLDGIPESIVIGLSMLAGGTVSIVAVVAIFLSNLPEGLSSASGMKRAGRSAHYVLLLWGGIVLVSGISSLLGYTLFGGFSNEVIAATMAVSAGAVLAMIADTMIPEAFEVAHNFTGLITVLGFLTSF